ncbi:MAG: type II secretion system F family protein [Bacillota bacterium]
MSALPLIIGMLLGSLVFLLVFPHRGFGPSAGASYLAQEAGIPQRSWLERWEERQRTLLSSSGVDISFRAYLIGQFAGAGLMLVLVTPLFGIYAGIAVGVAVFLIVREVLVSFRQARLHRFNTHFREALVSMTNSLRAGQSLSSALENCVTDLRRLLGRDDELIIVELKQVVEEIRLGLAVEDALQNLKLRVPFEEVAQFVDAASITRNKGGNLTEVMTNVSKLISDRLAVLQEIQVLTAEKRFEGALIASLPVAMLLFLTLFSPDYMEPLTGTWYGQIIVGIGLFMVLGAYLWSRSLTRIDV